ncbi:Alpha/beta hydrolase family protein [Anatilimnocola aggregata]|uniref:Alpha/beta hydrolase family protein n=1 Tax=Anatilimnocola aggregata TaxID=2528021 RepID=A0A517YCU8_9BACT|nr:prolyl oligopeptidase family serine peptidase [Anatilimnocola aggregata]QDU27952.1 Alpha/beta hydrolase family protein [Anatilimnocola aggregata]
MTDSFPDRGSTSFNRRDWLTASGLAASASVLSASLPDQLWSAEGDTTDLPPLNRFPRMVQEFFVDQVRTMEAQGDAARAALKTKEDAERYVKGIRAKIQQVFGPWPEKTPLNAKTTSTVERDTYRIENVIFESRPNFFVTANLYVPKNRKFPLPGVVGSCGHSANGKAIDAYQSFAQGLARQGYVVLLFDPIGQGERLQYVDENLKPRRGVSVSEHLYAGNQQFLVGDFFGAWRAWDGIRALDYLLTREEVDPKHVGITGNSGGGTMTTWLCGVEDRWTMAAPSCFVTTFRRNLENELPADTEQCPPRAIALGLDHADFLAAMAPKPVIILAKERDYFDVRGAKVAYERLKNLYTLLGKPENISFFVGPTEHGYSIENREAMYGWFNRATGIAEGQTEPKLTIEKDDTLRCTPHGQVAGIRSRSVFNFTQDKAIELGKQHKKRDVSALAEAITSTLKLPTRTGAPDYRILRPVAKREYPTAASTSYAIESEPGVFALVTKLSEQSHYSRPPKGKGPAILYVAHHSSDAELRNEPLIQELIKAEPNVPFFACDVRGIGESRPNTAGADQFLRPYGSDYFYASHSFMLDRPYVGQKTHDVLSVLDWLADNGYTDIHLAGLGWGSIPAALAGFLSKHVKRVTLKNNLTSYEAIAISEGYDWPVSSFIPGVLGKFDLPEVYRVLELKQLKQIEPRGAVQTAPA